MNPLLVWVDLETSSSQESAHVLEIGAVVTDKFGNQQGQSFHVVLPFKRTPQHNIPAEVLEMHTRNGLWDAAENAEKVTSSQIDDDLFFWATRGVVSEQDKNQFILAGSGVSHFDRKFLKREYPKFESIFAYYSIDVGVLRRVWRFAGRNAILQNFEANEHRALSDVFWHIEQYKLFLSEIQLMSRYGITV